MKIGVNYKKITSYIDDMMNNLGNTFQFLFEKVSEHSNNISSLDTRVTSLENSSGGGVSEWVEITSANGQEAEITQPFTEIRMLAKAFNGNYTVTVPYDNIIFHNSSSDAPTYIIVGNPIENNYGCKFKYMKQPISEKQDVCVDSCFSGGSQDSIEFRAWIKPDNSPQ